VSYVCKVCHKEFSSHLNDRDICFSCKISEEFWRQKIADEVENAWSNFILRNYYSNDLATKMIVEYIRSGNNETLQ
jgi:hypothetical protein